VQLTPLSTHWAPRKKIKKRVQSFSDTVYVYVQFITDSTDHIRHSKGSEIYGQ